MYVCVCVCVCVCACVCDRDRDRMCNIVVFTALSQMTSSYASVLSNVHDVAAQKNLACSLRQIVDVTKELKQVLAAKRPRKTVATSTPMPMSHPVLLTRGARVDAENSMTTEMKQHTPYISMQMTISPIHMSGKAPFTYSTPIESSPSPYSPSIVMQPSLGGLQHLANIWKDLAEVTPLGMLRHRPQCP